MRNAGALQGGVPLLPGARPDDGRLDVLVLTSRGWPGRLALAADVLMRRERTSREVCGRVRELRTGLDPPRPRELDGEAVRYTRHLEICVQPGALLVRVPRP